MRLHHNALVVEDMDEAVKVFCDSLGMKLVLRRPGRGDNIEIAFVEEPKTGHRLEFLLRKEGAGRMDHVAYEVENVDEAFKSLVEKEGFKVDREPYWIEPKTYSAFLRDKNGFRIQLVKYS